MTAPDSDNANVWGLYQFPNIWRGDGGRYFLSVNVGQDTYGRIGIQKGRLYYWSSDGLNDWQPVDFPIEGHVPHPDSRTSNDKGTLCEAGSAFPVRDVGLKPQFCVLSPNEVGMLDAYRYGDLPEGKRTFSFSVKQPTQGEWREVQAVLDFPDLLRLAVTRSRMSSQSEWQEVAPVLSTVVPKEIVMLPDGTFIGGVCGQSANIDTYFYNTYCVASSDCGRTWRKRGTIAHQPEASTHGYGSEEFSLVRTASGKLLCAMRTDLCSYDTEATVATMLACSDDDGRSWSTPRVIAPTSVTPHLVALDNGVIALVYGRPGVHLLFSIDEGHTWRCPVRVVGSTLEEVKARAEAAGRKNYIYDIWTDQETCANTAVVKHAPNAFLLAYSDFKHKDKVGRVGKANMVVEVAATRP